MQQRSRAVCFIIGAGHSGSTLVGMILGAHPEVFYAGEAAKAKEYRGPQKSHCAKERASCVGLSAVFGQIFASRNEPIFMTN